uniref:Uncharacterized protein n=2 Tax=Sus scrofa TaxID=9823 RepID=A0A8D1XVV5_PIG
MALYNEDLLKKNPFYLALQKWCPDLSNKVAQAHGIILVLWKGSLSSSLQSTCQFESYVLIPMKEHFQILNGKDTMRHPPTPRCPLPWDTTHFQLSHDYVTTRVQLQAKANFPPLQGIQILIHGV